MKTDNTDTVQHLEQKLRTIAQLESQVAPKGVNFALRGQEDASCFSTSIGTLRDPIAAADAVIRVLEDARSMMAEEADIAARAIGR